ASGNVVSGFCIDVTLSPAACNRGMTSDQDDPSANSPCTSTTLLAFAGVAATPRVEISEAAAPATRAVEKARLFIVMISLPSGLGGMPGCTAGATQCVAQHPGVRWGAGVHRFLLRPAWAHFRAVRRHRAIAQWSNHARRPRGFPRCCHGRRDS